MKFDRRLGRNYCSNKLSISGYIHLWKLGCHFRRCINEIDGRECLVIFTHLTFLVLTKCLLSWYMAVAHLSYPKRNTLLPYVFIIDVNYKHAGHPSACINEGRINICIHFPHCLLFISQSLVDTVKFLIQIKHGLSVRRVVRRN